MNIVCLDLGTTTGYCVGKSGQVISGSKSFKPQRYEGGGMRYLRFSSWLDEILSLCGGQIDVLYFEEVRRHAGTGAAHVYGGFMAVLTAWCESHSVPYSGIPVGTIKLAMTGKGNASKEAMIEAVKKHGFNPTDDNEADAIAIYLHTSPPQAK